MHIQPQVLSADVLWSSFATSNSVHPTLSSKLEFSSLRVLIS